MSESRQTDTRQREEASEQPESRWRAVGEVLAIMLGMLLLLAVGLGVTAGVLKTVALQRERAQAEMVRAREAAEQARRQAEQERLRLQQRPDGANPAEKR